MKFEPKAVTLKNGETATLRSPTTEDAAPMLEYLNICAEETDFVLRYPEECTDTLEQEIGFLQAVSDSPDRLMIACEIEGQIAGNCSITFNTRLKTRHRADLAIGVVRKHWGKGIGTALFQEMIAAARARGILQMELEVIEGNERAMGLYRKMGFTVAAEKPNAIRLKDGRLLKEYFMVKTL